jgi:hypothetical protein
MTRPSTAVLSTFALLALAVAGCANKPAPNAAALTPQRTFASPEEAAGVFKDAVATKDRNLLLELYGPEGVPLLLTGDPVQENNAFDRFSARLTEQLRVDRPADDRAVLYVGAENWPFPIPLVKGQNGWYFDTAAGVDEILNRRIGRNELGAIATCRAYVAAQQEYARVPRDESGVTHYATRLRSNEGKKDGLYWPVNDNEPVSPMGPLVAAATLEGYDPTKSAIGGKRQPYHGYFFHILKAQGDAAPGGKKSYLDGDKLTKGFALIAAPAEYGASGVMTFCVNQDGKIYEKDLGPQTVELAKAVTEYNPDSTWHEVKD